MVGAVVGKYLPFYSAAWTDRHRVGLKPLAQFTQDLFGWHLAGQQIDQASLQGMHADCAVDLYRLLSLDSLQGKLLCRRTDYDAFHIAQEHRRGEVLLHRFDCLAAAMLQIHA